MNPTDPIAVIREADPVVPSSISGFGDSPTGKAILARIVDDSPPALLLPRRAAPKRPALRVLAVAAVAATMLAAAVTLTRSPTSPLSAGCYETASRQADTAVIDLGTDGRGAVEACAEIWLSGFGEPVPSPSSLASSPVGDSGCFLQTRLSPPKTSAPHSVRRHRSTATTPDSAAWRSAVSRPSSGAPRRAARRRIRLCDRH